MTKKLINIIIFIFLLLMTIASIVAAFLGSTKAGSIAGSLPVLCCGIILIILFAISLFMFPRLIKAPGLLMIHVGCIIILLGAIIGGTYSHYIRQDKEKIPQMGPIRIGKIFRGQMQIDEGRSNSVNRNISDDGVPAVHVLSYKVHLKDFRIEFYDSGMVKDYISEIMIVSDDGQHHGPFEIEVNKPLHFDGYHFYQSSYGRYSDGSFYTVLGVVSDNGLWLVYSGFFLLLSGVFWHLWLKPIAEWQLTRNNTVGVVDGI